MNNLIGVSGKIGSGKDLVGSIIQYLADIDTDTDSTSFDEWLGFPLEDNYQIKKYADKLKDIVCLMIGCTRADLEDREFKEKPLGEEWDVYKVHDGSVFRSVTKEYYNSTHKQKFIEKRTPRLLLQLMGTECGRQTLHPNIWINALFAEYKQKVIHGVKTYKEEPIAEKAYTTSLGDYPNWIITDVRFPDEVKAIEDRGGIVIRLDRWNTKEVTRSEALSMYHMNEEVYYVDNDGVEGLCDHLADFEVDWEKYVVEIGGSNHESETALDNHDFKHRIENNGSIEELIEKVRECLK